jgi:ribosomal protein L28
MWHVCEINALTVLVGNPERTRSLGRRRRRWKDNITIYITQIGRESRGWINPAKIRASGKLL